MRGLALLLAAGLIACAPAAERSAPLPEGFVYLRDVAPTAVQDIRYVGPRNFTGAPVPGYAAPQCVLLRAPAEALARVQADLEADGLSLIVLDCFRPQRAVDAFVAWAADPSEDTKAEYYPNVAKSALFDEGYIAARSGHSRGATVDVGLTRKGGLSGADPDVSCIEATEAAAPRSYLDFGTAFDCFDPLSHTANPAIAGDARANRDRLVAAMAAHGFANYANEWWHFTYRPEPRPDTYFDFEIR